jgi:putative ABC transport system permease protein
LRSIFVKRFSGDPSQQGTPKERKRRPILPEYGEYVKRFCPSIEEVSVALWVPPVTRGKAMSARVRGFETENFTLAGVTPNGIRVQPRNFTQGRYFTDDENQRAARVAVLGSLVAEALFPAGKPIGEAISIDGAEYIVIGVSEPAKGGFFGENGIDKQITVPLSTAELRYPQADNFLINAKAYEGKRDEAYEEMRSILRKLRRTPANEDNDFDLTTPDQIIKQFDQVSSLIILASIAISGLGLLVGGIGVMNIMLVSVTERTREIGVRKALGARKVDIIFQFLTEAVTLTGVGGAVGIAFSMMVTLAVATMFPALPSETPLWAIMAGVGVSVAVGVFFGVWPAMKAARLDPVEALRYE